jgi:Secretion system C-terminal sorting domain
MNYPVTITANPGAGAGPFTYSWSGPGGYTATGISMTRPDVAGSAAGTYTLVDTLGGCPSAAATVVVTLTANSLVSVNVTMANPTGASLCKGDSAIFNTTIVNGGPDPVYQWYKGLPDTPIVGAIWDNWSSAGVYNGEHIYCVLTSDAVCAYPLTVTSNTIILSVLDSTPVANITVVPDSNILPGANVTFNAYAYYPSTITVFQWYVDDTLVPGANSPFFTLTGVTAEATVKLQVFTPSKCASPDTAFSNTIGLHFNTGVVNVSDAFQNVELYPNPARNILNVTGGLQHYQGSTVPYSITNVMGQTVQQGVMPVKNEEIRSTLSLEGFAEGIYMIRMGNEGQSRVSRFAVTK